MTTITTTEFQQLKKLMDMTFSDQDGEVLNAIRLVNRLLAKHNLSWRNILERTVTIDVEAAPVEKRQPLQAQEKTATDKAIDDAFAVIQRYGKWNKFIASLHEQWEKNGSLSPAQREALFRNEERVVEGT